MPLNPKTLALLARIKEKASQTSRKEAVEGLGEILLGGSCIACSGSGKNSKGNSCYPCAGTGKEGEMRNKL